MYGVSAKTDASRVKKVFGGLEQPPKQKTHRFRPIDLCLGLQQLAKCCPWNKFLL